MMTGFNEPSNVGNNDFSLETSGWDVIRAAGADIVSHAKDAGPGKDLQVLPVFHLNR
jgi:hypothetical protein